MGRWTTAAALLALLLLAVAMLMAISAADAQQVTSDTVYDGENLVLTEDLEVSGGAKLTIRSCDITFHPPGTAPLYIRVVSGSLEITDSIMVGEGAGFIVWSYGDTVIRNVTTSGLGAQANSSLRSRGLPLSAHGGFMFYNAKVTVSNLDITGAPATALYAEDSDVDVVSLGTRDACSAYTGTDQCAAVAITFLGTPIAGPSLRTAVINGSKIQTSNNHGLLVAAAATGYRAKVTVEGTEISSSAASGLLVYEVNYHGNLTVDGDGNDIHNSGGDGVLWVRRSASGGLASLDLRDSRIFSITGDAFRVDTSGSSGEATLELDGCTITDTRGRGTAITATGCTQNLNVTLRDSSFVGVGGVGLYFTTDGDGKTSAYLIELVDSELEDSASYGIYTRVSQAYATFELRLVDSRVTGSGSDGIRQEYNLTYFDSLTAPSVTANLTLERSVISDNEGYGVYDTRYLKSYYSSAQEKATLFATVNVLDTTIRNHTKSAVVVTPTTQLQYTTYTSETFIEGSTFVNNSGYGYYEKVDALTQTNGGRTVVGWHVGRSTFRDLANSGVYVEVRRADNAVISFDVANSTFTDLGDHGAVLTTSSTPYTGNLVANLLDCTFTDLGDKAYYLRPGRPGTTGNDHRVRLARVRAHNTTGIYIDLDGYATEDRYRLAIDHVNVTATRGDAIDVNVHPYQSARMETVLSHVEIGNTNGTALSITYTSDRSMPLWGHLTGDNITLLNSEVGGLELYEHTGIIRDLTIRGSGDFDLHKVDNRVPLDETGVLELHSTSMDRKKVSVTGTGALWVHNTLTVKVEWQNGMSALGAGIQVQDRTFQVVAVGHVEGEEGMDPVELLAYILDATEFRSRSPFIVNITFLDLEQTGVCSLDEPATVRIVVHDRVAPSAVILEPDDGAAQRASYFELRGSAFDAHAGVYQIRYRLDVGEWTYIEAEAQFSTTVEGVGPGVHLLELEVIDRAGNVASESIHINIDYQPPDLVVASPKGDIITRDPLLVVRGETEDGANVSVNGAKVENLNGLFIAEVQLQEGSNTITVVSMDRLSNVATVRFNVTLDTVEPFLDIQSHEEGDWVSTTDVTIQGLVEAGCTLTVNGRRVTVDDQNFTAAVTLKNGNNSVNFRAVDLAGNELDRVIHLFVSTDVPWINLKSPVEGGIYAQREVRVLAAAQPGASVSINDRPVTIKQGLVDELLILPEGTSTITIDVTDPAGLRNTVTVQVSVDTVDPVLTIEPLPQRTADSQVTVKGTAAGATQLFLDGEAVPLDVNGTFSVNVTLDKGANTINLLCRDGVGHEASASARVVQDSTPPLLRLVLPGMEDRGNGTWVADKRSVTVQVVSEPGASLTLNGLYVLVGEDGTANVDLTLEDETNKVTVLVVDDLGNAAQVEYTVVYEPAGVVEAGRDWMSLLPTIMILALLIAIVLVVVKYRSLAKRMSRRPGPPQRRNGNGGSGNGYGGPHDGNGRPSNGNGGRGAGPKGGSP